jgi:hypothetical protein
MTNRAAVGLATTISLFIIILGVRAYSVQRANSQEIKRITASLSQIHESLFRYAMAHDGQLPSTLHEETFLGSLSATNRHFVETTPLRYNPSATNKESELALIALSCKHGLFSLTRGGSVYVNQL